MRGHEGGEEGGADQTIPDRAEVNRARKGKREEGTSPQVDLRDVLGDKNYAQELRVFVDTSFFFGVAAKYR